jgi:hypothetical protein
MMKLSGSWKPRAADPIRPMAALFDSEIPFINFHSRVACGSQQRTNPNGQSGTVASMLQRNICGSILKWLAISSRLVRSLQLRGPLIGIRWRWVTVSRP